MVQTTTQLTIDLYWSCGNGTPFEVPCLHVWYDDHEPNSSHVQDRWNDPARIAQQTAQKIPAESMGGTSPRSRAFVILLHMLGYAWEVSRGLSDPGWSAWWSPSRVNGPPRCANSSNSSRLRRQLFRARCHHLAAKTRGKKQHVSKNEKKTMAGKHSVDGS